MAGLLRFIYQELETFPMRQISMRLLKTKKKNRKKEKKKKQNNMRGKISRKIDKFCFEKGRVNEVTIQNRDMFTITSKIAPIASAMKLIYIVPWYERRAEASFNRRRGGRLTLGRQGGGITTTKKIEMFTYLREFIAQSMVTFIA